MAGTSEIINQIAPSFNVGPAILLAIFIFIIAFVGVFAAIFFFLWKDAKSWNLTLRVHPENPEVKGCNLTNAIVKAKRVRMRDGKTVFYYKTPILGYTISPALTTYTRPLTYDIIVTQDKRIFCIKRIAAIDKQRKELNVDIMHPDIEYDMVELQKYNDSLAKDNKFDKWKTIAKIAGWFIILTGLIIGTVLIGNYWVEGKQLEAQKEANYIKLQELQNNGAERMQETLTIVQLILPELQELKGTKNLHVLLNETE